MTVISMAYTFFPCEDEAGTTFAEITPTPELNGTGGSDESPRIFEVHDCHCRNDGRVRARRDVYCQRPSA
jgi:hypothetical protein